MIYRFSFEFFSSLDTKLFYKTYGEKSQNSDDCNCNDDYKYEISNKHQEETFNYERGKEGNVYIEEKKSLLYICAC